MIEIIIGVMLLFDTSADSMVYILRVESWYSTCYIWTKYWL